MTQINAIEPIARTFVETYRNGKHIAYQRSIEMNVNVSTDTVTETVCKKELEFLSEIKICFFFFALP